MQGGPLEHTIAAKATCFKIAATEAFKDYQTQVRANADVLAETVQAGGIDVLTGGTDTHLLQLDLRSTEWTGKDAEERLAEVKLTVNRNTVPSTSGRRGRVRAPDRDAGGDDARVRRGGLRARWAGSSSARSATTRTSRHCRAEPRLCARRPLYPGFRGFTTYVA